MTAGVFRCVVLMKNINVVAYSFRKCSNQTKILTKAVSYEGNLSTLFVPSRYGSDVYQIVKPLIDIDYICNNIGKLKLSCDLRGINLDIDYTLKLAIEWTHIRDSYSSLIKKFRDELEELNRLKSLNIDNKDEIDMFENQKENTLKSLISTKEKVWDIEDLLMPRLQKLPHILDPATPLQFSVADVHLNPPIPKKEQKPHVEIGQKLSLLSFVNDSSVSCYFSGKLAELELALQSYFVEKISCYNYHFLSCMDFCKSFILEAIGLNPYSPSDSLVLKLKSDKAIGQKLHLVGASSFGAFCAYLTNMNVNKTTLPLQYVSVGRHYDASKRTNFPSLFSVVQSSNIHLVTISEPKFSNTEFASLVNILLSCYSELNIPYRTVDIAANSLTIAESRRKQFELWSPVLQDFVTVAYVSQHDDFVSKRLHITFGEQHSVEGYCGIIEGSVVNIPVLLGCIIENYQTDDCNFDYPDALKSYLI